MQHLTRLSLGTSIAFVLACGDDNRIVVPTRQDITSELDMSVPDAPRPGPREPALPEPPLACAPTSAEGADSCTMDGDGGSGGEASGASGGASGAAPSEGPGAPVSDGAGGAAASGNEPSGEAGSAATGDAGSTSEAAAGGASTGASAGAAGSGSETAGAAGSSSTAAEGTAGAGGAEGSAGTNGGSGAGGRDGAATDGGAGGSDGETAGSAGAAGSADTGGSAGLSGSAGASGEGGASSESRLLPDFVVDPVYLAQTVFEDSLDADVDMCLFNEGCVTGSGLRRIVRFGTRTGNIGTADVVLGRPELENPLWEFDVCHEHFHFEGYAQYDLLVAGTGEVLPIGNKNGFCLRDNGPWDVSQGDACATYDCENQGIGAGCSDVYTPDLDCQWIDITDVAPGLYDLKITVNPDGALPELDSSNNSVSVPIEITADSVRVAL